MKKRAIIREPLVRICGSLETGLVLGRLIELTSKLDDDELDEYIGEEFIGDAYGQASREHGWIKASANQIRSDVLLTETTRSTSRRLHDLYKIMLVDRRKNPDDPFDKTLQYRINARALITDVKALGEDYLAALCKEFKWLDIIEKMMINPWEKGQVHHDDSTEDSHAERAGSHLR